MRPRHIASLIVGLLLVLPGLGMMLGGGAIGVYELTASDDGGWHAVDIDRLASEGVAVTTAGAVIEIGGPSAVADWVDLDVRVSATPTTSAETVFIGVAPVDDLSAYLAGAQRDEVRTVGWRGDPTYRHVAGSRTAVAAPTSQSFWVERATGPGTQELTWRPKTGHWSIAIMNASGEPGVNVSAHAAFRSGALTPLAVGLIVAGLVLAIIGTVLVVVAVKGRQDQQLPGAYPPSGVVGGTGDPYFAAGRVEPGRPSGPSGWTSVEAAHVHPLVLEARLAPNLSRGLWLVKWLAAIPHFVVLAFLWAGTAVLTIVAWFAILFTGRYPRSLFDYNVGVLRWTWRVSHYCGTGGLGSDRYPPFTLDELPDDDTHLTVDYPEELSRGLIFVKWLLLLPHWIVVAIIAGSQSSWTNNEGVRYDDWPGILGLLTLVAGIILLFTGSANRGLYDVIVGLNRWVYRVGVYALLMTDAYPPFRYDGGATEPAIGPPPAPGSAPASASSATPASEPVPPPPPKKPVPS